MCVCVSLVKLGLLFGWGAPLFRILMHQLRRRAEKGKETRCKQQRRATCPRPEVAECLIRPEGVSKTRRGDVECPRPEEAEGHLAASLRPAS